jgi:hypothetical protein
LQLHSGFDLPPVGAMELIYRGRPHTSDLLERREPAVKFTGGSPLSEGRTYPLIARASSYSPSTYYSTSQPSASDKIGTTGKSYFSECRQARIPNQLMDFEDWRHHPSCLRTRQALNGGIIILVLATLGI